MISTKELKYYIRKLELSLIEREKKYLENESDLYLGATEEQKSAILDSSEVPWQFFLPIFLKSRKRLHKHNLRKGVNFMKNVIL